MQSVFINTPGRFCEFIVAFGRTTTVHFQVYELAIFSTTYHLSTILDLFVIDFRLSVLHCAMRIVKFALFIKLFYF